MCMLCFARPSFTNPSTDGGNPRVLREKAMHLKDQIKVHESVLVSQLEAGNEPCQNTIRKLADLRKQQYDLAQRL